MPNKYIPKELRYVYAVDISHFLVSFTSNWCKSNSISILRGSNFWRLYCMSLVLSSRIGFSYFCLKGRDVGWRYRGYSFSSLSICVSHN
jgi:hypothetical protein